jgi:hypothetical protein
VTLYAHVSSGVVDALGSPPAPDGDATVPPHRDLRRFPPEQLAQHGWLEVRRTPRPPDTAGTVHDWSVAVVDGVPVEVWTPRPRTAPEAAAWVTGENEKVLKASPQTQIAGLLGAVAALQAVRDRTNAAINSNPAASIKDVVAAVLPVARAEVRLARLVLRALDSSEDTA